MRRSSAGPHTPALEDVAEDVAEEVAEEVAAGSAESDDEQETSPAPRATSASTDTHLDMPPTVPSGGGRCVVPGG
ncbi:hypothetical protein ACI79M_12650 [Geodermatophilus sp. SYSU D00803]